MDPASPRWAGSHIGPWSPPGRDGIRPRYDDRDAGVRRRGRGRGVPGPFGRAGGSLRSALRAGQPRVGVDLVVGHGRAGRDVDPERLVEGGALGKLREVVGRPVRGVRVGHVGEGERLRLALALGVDLDVLAGREVPEQDPLRQGVLDLALDGAAQRTRTEHGAVALLGEQVLGGLRELHAHVLVLEPLVELGDLEVDDLDDLVAAQVREDDGVVDTVEELGPEVLLELVGDLGLHPLVVRAAVGSGREAHVGLGDVPRAEVGRHDDDGVLEVDHPTLRVGEAAVLEHLQQRVEDLRMGLLDLVEENDREGLAAHLLGELATLLVTDVAGRRAEQPAHRVLLGVLGHVELDQRVLAAEEELGERLGELGLADTGGAGEDERATGAARVLEAGTGAADRLGQRLDGVVHADDALVQLVLHVEQPAGLLLGQLEDRDAGARRQDLGDELLVDLGHDIHVARLPLGLTGGLLLAQALLVVADARGALEVLAVDGRLLLAHERGDLLVELAQVRRSRHPTDAQSRARLVDEVDGLVGQEAVVDVAVGHVGGRDERTVGDRHAVVGLVAVTQTLEDLDRVRQRRLLHLDRLEAPLEGRVLLDVLAVLVERRRTDRLQLTTGEHRLENRRRVDGALGGTRTDERVDLVDEDDDVAAGADLLEDLLQPLLEVTAVAAAGHERAEVEGIELLVLERLGHLALDDVLGEALDDGGLADAGLADEDGVVLGAAGQHLHDPLDLFLTSDDRVELALAGSLREVATELVEHEGARGRPLGLALADAGAGLLAALATLVAGEQLDDLLADLVELRAELDEDLGGDALALADQAEQDVLGADVAVAELERLAERVLEDLLRAGREGNVTGGGLLPLADDLLDLGPDRFERDVERFEGLRGDAFAFVDQTQEDVLGPDVVVVEQASFLLREDNHPSGPVGEPFEHVLLLTDRETSRCYLCPLWTSTPRPTPVVSLLFPILSVIGSGSAAVRRERTDAERRVVILAYAVSYPPSVRPHCCRRVSHPWRAVADASIRAAFRHRTAPWRGFGFGQPRHRARNRAMARSSAPSCRQGEVARPAREVSAPLVPEPGHRHTGSAHGPRDPREGVRRCRVDVPGHDHEPPDLLVVQRLVAADVAEPLLVRLGVLPAVVLDDQSEGEVGEVVSPQQGPVVVVHPVVHLGLGKSGEDDEQPQARLHG